MHFWQTSDHPRFHNGNQKRLCGCVCPPFAGKLHSVIDQTFPMDEIRAAHERLEKGEQLGKITLSIP
ncbi:MAG: zinc-binding dehydrogenase [Anaerolineae bacterium]|nr:zinc-binding dehydrogenase [Anaerolineae bacterium]